MEGVATGHPLHPVLEVITVFARHINRDSSGFTLIELLIVVLIIGILAAIAIPIMVSQRQKGYRSALMSDIRNGATLMEDYYSENSGYPGVGPIPGLQLSEPGMTVAVVIMASTGYCIEGTHTGVDLDGDGSPDDYRYDTRIDMQSAGVQEGACPP